MSFYSINITDIEGESYAASGSGDVSDIGYLAKSGLRRIAGTDGEYVVRITQGAFINDKDAKTVLNLTADVETIELVTNRKLAALRKQERAASNERDAVLGELESEQKENEEAFGGDAAPEPGDEEYDSPSPGHNAY